MAGPETLAAISNALSQLFAPQIARQFNQQAVTASIIPVGRGSGKNCSWDAEFSGATADAVEEGSDVDPSEFNTNDTVPATLPWGIYRSAFQITELALDAAAGSIGSPDALLDLFGERVFNATTRLASKINADVINGTGVNQAGKPNVVGLLGGATDATGVYAGINRATYAEWAGNVLGNGGVPRPLTLDLLYQADQAIFTACGEPATHIITSPGVYRKYAGLFESIRRVVTAGGAPALMAAGVSTPAAGTTPVNSPLAFDTMPVVRDRNFPTGKLIMLNVNYARIRYLPKLNPGDAFGFAATTLTGSTGGSGETGAPGTTQTGIPAWIRLLGKTGDSVKAYLTTTIQLEVRRPNAFCQVIDISET